ISVALLRVSRVPVGERLHVRAFAREIPLALRAHALAHSGAFYLRLMKPVHDFGLVALLVGPRVTINAEALFDHFASTATLCGELLTHALLVLRRVPFFLTLAF